MQKQEIDYLKLEKKNNGKLDDQINEEIDFLIDSQVEFKKINKEM